MLKFLFGGKAAKAKLETQRETLERALGEVNDILDKMTQKAKVSIDLNTGLIEIDLPEQMPDEALALPAPNADEADQSTRKPEDKASESDKKAA